MRTLAPYLVVALCRVASADPTSGHTAPLLPTVKLEASTTGTAKFNVGIDRTTPWEHDPNQDSTWSLAYRTTTNDGIGTLLKIDDNSVKLPTDWQLAAGWTLTFLRRFHGVSSEVRDLTDHALRRCLRLCAPTEDKDDAGNKKFCKVAREAVPGADLAHPTSQQIEIVKNNLPVPEADYCPKGIEVIKDAPDETLRDAAVVVPQGIFSGGLMVGSTTFDFLNIDPMDASHLTKATTTDASVTGVASGVYVTDDLLALELDGRIQSKTVASTKKARWCVPAGKVDTGTATSVPAEMCDERPLGKPVTRKTIDVAAYIGTVNRGRSMRVSIGVSHTRQPPDGSTAQSVWGIRAPVLFATDILPGTGIYKGMLRLTPSVQLTTVGSTTDAQLLVTLEVLTSRSLFGTALDAF